MAERPLFDPSRIKPSEPDEASPRTVSTLSVRQVNELIRGAVNRHVPPTLHVLGEIGDLSRPASGHLYFTLKDSDSELRCVMWRSAAASLKFRPEVGLGIIATGGIEVYLPRGAYQLVVRRIEPRGVGALEIAFRQLKEKLAREGLFDPARKRLLPRVPQRIAVVTSPSGAVIRDIVQTIRRRFAALELLVFPVRVQGEGAADEIAVAIRQLNEHAAALGGIDLAIVARGGGSLEDLWAFNEEVVARAIVASAVPIVSGVGHETDVTICDLVADLRAPTPTAAAELVTPMRSDLIDELDRQARRATRAARHHVELERAGLQRLLAHHRMARPQAMITERAQRIDELSQRLLLARMRAVRSARERLARLEIGVLRIGSSASFARADGAITQRVYRLRQALDAAARRHERRLSLLAAAMQRWGPSVQLERQREHLRQALLRLMTAARLSLRSRRQSLELRLEAVAACDPKSVLRRGYSVTRDAKTRQALRSIREVTDGQRIITQLADGEFRATADDPRQPGLFERD